MLFMELPYQETEHKGGDQALVIDAQVVRRAWIANRAADSLKILSAVSVAGSKGGVGSHFMLFLRCFLLLWSHHYIAL
jgi:hypothetical protein